MYSFHKHMYLYLNQHYFNIIGWTHTHPFYGSLDFVWDYPSEPVPEPIWILLKQETVSGSGISWAICKSAPRPRLITTPAPHHSVFYKPDALPAAQPTVSKQSSEGMALKALNGHQKIHLAYKNTSLPHSIGFP